MAVTSIVIVFADHAPVYGGAEVVLVRLASRLDRARYWPLLAIGPCEPMEQACKSASVAYQILDYPSLNRRSMRSAVGLLRGASSLRLLLRRSNAQVLHTNTLRTHILSALVRMGTRIPVVWTVNDLTCPPRLFHLLSRFPTRIICVSEAIKNYYYEWCVDPEKMQVIYNGVPITDVGAADVLMMRDSLQLRDCRLVLLPGRLVRGKGHDVFLRAVAIVTKVAPDARFIIAGGGSSPESTVSRLVEMGSGHGGGTQYEAELMALVDALHLHQVVIFTGHISSMTALYHASDVVVHAGTMEEGLPTTPLEAMAAGKPVVVTDIEAMHEIVEDGFTGSIVPSGNADRLAQALITLLQDPVRAETIGRAGRDRVTRLFNSETNVLSYMAMYDDLLLIDRQRGNHAAS